MAASNRLRRTSPITILGKWYRHEDADALTSLGLSIEQVFPFDWRFAIPLEEDIFHLP
jgi:hypothetical protein